MFQTSYILRVVVVRELDVIGTFRWLPLKILGVFLNGMHKKLRKTGKTGIFTQIRICFML